MVLEANFKAVVVCLILNKQTEEALEMLAKNYRVNVPELKVGLPKGHHRNAYGCYSSKTENISLLDSDMLGDPFVVLHEFYHHLRSRSVDKQHKGTEKNADKFASEYIQAFDAVAKSLVSGN